VSRPFFEIFVFDLTTDYQRGSAASEVLTADLKRGRFPLARRYPSAALASTSLIPSARFADSTDKFQKSELEGENSSAALWR
jgi:hypothetical protein